MPNPLRISVLISGGGTTLKNLIGKKLSGNLDVEICQVISNKPSACGLKYAEEAGIKSHVVPHQEYDSVPAFSDAIFDLCRSEKVELVVMGGFLRRVAIPQDFENRVINIHPSLIPSFCGKGHYGSKVHQAVIDYGCKVSGCTVHFVDDEYDHGPIIAQRTVDVLADDTASTLAARVFESECELYPEVLNQIAAGSISVTDRTVSIIADA